MALLDLWISDRTQITSKRLQQLIAFAGEGVLKDGNDTSSELRALLAVVPSELIVNWVEELLRDRFGDFGFVMQDIVNEVGARLGFDVEPGAYRGRQGQPGQDGIWKSPDGRVIIVESKASTTYKISLSRISAYRESAAATCGLNPDEISILVIVTEEDTEELEAQVRGSRYAWSVRLLGIRSLLKLLKTNESLDDPSVRRQIQSLLYPQEFTRLDRIIDLVFATAEDSQEAEDEVTTANEGDEDYKSPPAAFHSAIIPQLEIALGTPLIKRARVVWAAPDGTTLVSCQVSRARDDGPGRILYWFGLKKKTQETLSSARTAYSAFGLGTPELVVLLPFNIIEENLDRFFTSPDADGSIRHYHIRFRRSPDGLWLLTDRDRTPLDVSEFVVAEKLAPLP